MTDTEALREALATADNDVSLIHDFFYGRGGTVDEANEACWRIHDVLRPAIAALATRPSQPDFVDKYIEDYKRDMARPSQPADDGSALDVARLARALDRVEKGIATRHPGATEVSRQKAEAIAAAYEKG